MRIIFRKIFVAGKLRNIFVVHFCSLSPSVDFLLSALAKSIMAINGDQVVQFLECTTSDSRPLRSCEQKKHVKKSTLEREPSLNLAIIGNCTFSALIDPFGCFVWSCMPQLDSEPVFNALLAGNDAAQGFWDVQIEDFDYRCVLPVVMIIYKFCDQF